MNENYGAGTSSSYGSPWGAALGAIGSGIGSMMQSNPADAASQYYNQIPDMLKGIYSPYMQNGQTAFNTLSGYMNNGLNAGKSLNSYIGNGLNAGNTLSNRLNMLTQNPGQFMQQLGQGFQQSPGYQFQVNQALGAANRAAAAGGMAGSPMEQQQLAGTVNNLANQDYYNYLNHAMGAFDQGMQGLQSMYGLGGQIGSNMYGIGANVGNNIYNTGANMANQYGTNLADTMMNQGNLAYAGQINQNQAQGGGIGSLLGGIGDIASIASNFL